jgi:hypothetical protein
LPTESKAQVAKLRLSTESKAQVAQHREKIIMPTERKAQVANTESNIGCQPRKKLSLPTERHLWLPLERKSQVANMEKSSDFTCTVEVMGKDSVETQVKLILSFQKIFRNVPTLYKCNV